jgi:hypothetical protein
VRGDIRDHPFRFFEFVSLSAVAVVNFRHDNAAVIVREDIAPNVSLWVSCHHEPLQNLFFMASL